MSDVAIRVDNLSKKFYLGERVGIKTFREALQDLVTAPFRVWRKNGNGQDQEKVDTDREIWALKGVSFEVKHGEVLGVIGPNGAGKSTLLKILSRITEPTGGYAEIRGRVGSLLEVGTGFHPELTGRENVFLNGAILGMSKAEIRRKFDDIVAFAGVEKFIDTPVKRYSSGMQVRLAFAVAAHLDPEILIIDEVLAVGDAEFQKRCLGKMNEVSRSGRTVLFVSHNMAAVEGLCSRAILLDRGQILHDAPTDAVLSAYFTLNRSSPLTSGARLGSLISRAYLLNGSRELCTGIALGDDLTFAIEFTTRCVLRNCRFAIRIFTLTGNRVITCHTDYQYGKPLDICDGTRLLCTIRDCRLTPGQYTVEIQLDDRSGTTERISNALWFEVYPRDIYGTHKQLPAHAGVWHPDICWSVIPAQTPL